MCDGTPRRMKIHHGRDARATFSQEVRGRPYRIVPRE
jgi:hypothetical protein